MEAKVVVGLIGAGYAAGIHARAYRKVHGVAVELRSVVGNRPERAAAFAAEFGIPRVICLHRRAVGRPGNQSRRHLRSQFTPRRTGDCRRQPWQARRRRETLDWLLRRRRDNVDSISRVDMLRGAVASATSMVDAARANGVRLLYAENWVYAPAIQKVRQLMSAADGTILRIQGEESHSGSHAMYARRWETAGGGSLLGKGCHPLAAALYLKRAEGMARDGRPIRPRTVVAEVGRLTRSPSFVPSIRSTSRTVGMTSKTGARCSSRSRTARWPRSPPPTRCSAASATT